MKKTLLLIVTVLLIVLSSTIAFASTTEVEDVSEVYEDENVNISISKNYEYLYVDSKNETAVVFRLIIDGQEIRANHQKVMFSLIPFGEGYHDVKVILATDGDICYEKQFGLVDPVEYTIAYEETLQKMEEKYPILKEKLQSIEIAEEVNAVKVYEGLDGNSHAVLYLTMDSTEEQFEQQLEKVVVELAFPNLPDEKKEEIRKIL